MNSSISVIYWDQINNSISLIPEVATCLGHKKYLDQTINLVPVETKNLAYKLIYIWNRNQWGRTSKKKKKSSHFVFDNLIFWISKNTKVWVSLSSEGQRKNRTTTGCWRVVWEKLEPIRAPHKFAKMLMFY